MTHPFRYFTNSSHLMPFSHANFFRRILVVSLIIVQTLLPLSSGVAAQPAAAPSSTGTTTTTAPASGSQIKLAPIDSDVDGFIIYAVDGGVGCRDASLAERRVLGKRTPNVKLRRITHLDEVGDEKETPSAVRAESTSPAAAAAAATSPSVPAGSAGLKIILRATPQLDSYPEAKAAFIRAAATWESYISTPVTIIIDVDYGPTRFGTAWESSNTLGSTTTPRSIYDFSVVRRKLIEAAPSADDLALYNALPATSIPTDIGNISSVTVSNPLARALGLLPPVAAEHESAPKIGFNSNFSFDFEPGDGIAANKTDFDGVAVHEIGHALGFSSDSGKTFSASPQLTVWDLFRLRPGAGNFSSFATTQRVMTTGGEHVHFTGGPEWQLSTGGPNGEQGDKQQSSHWKDDALNGNNRIGIMDPTLPRGRREVITDSDLRALNSFGYQVGGIGQSPPPPPPPPANDNFVNAVSLSGASGRNAVSTIYATKESGEPSHSPDDNPGGQSVWYRWVAPGGGAATLTTAGSDYDTLLAVYTGTSVGALSPVVKNDDVVVGTEVTSTVTFETVAGTIYYIAVDGYDGSAAGSAGTAIINWTLPTSAPPPPAAAATVQFNTSSLSVAENAKSANITIVRSGDTASAVTLSYLTRPDTAVLRCDVVNGQASERCDYVTTLGSLSFAPGQTTASITIPLIDDVYVEGNETIALTLSAPIGATLGPNSSAMVTITDNDATSSVNNPVDTLSVFVRQQYLDFLAREPDQGGFDGWMAKLNQCPASALDNPNYHLDCTRTDVSAAFFRSPEFQQKGYYVYRFYAASLGRRPTYAEFIPDMARVTGQTDQEFEARRNAFPTDWVARAEFKNRYDALSNAQYVATLQQTAGVTLANADQLVTELNNGRTRGAVLREVVESAAVYDRYYNEAFVAMQYFGYLRRDPDSVGFEGWLSHLQRTGNYREMVWGFLYSPEHKLRFGPVPGF